MAVLQQTVLEAGNSDVGIAYPDESVREALTRMLQRDIGRLPVVTRDDPKGVVGYLSRGNVMSAHLKRLSEESVVQAGWLQDRIRPPFSGRSSSISARRASEALFGHAELHP